MYDLGVGDLFATLQIRHLQYNLRKKSSENEHGKFEVAPPNLGFVDVSCFISKAIWKWKPIIYLFALNQSTSSSCKLLHYGDASVYPWGLTSFAVFYMCYYVKTFNCCMFMDIMSPCQSSIFLMYFISSFCTYFLITFHLLPYLSPYILCYFLPVHTSLLNFCTFFWLINWIELICTVWV